jgi:HEAT repeat protein
VNVQIQIMRLISFRNNIVGIFRMVALIAAVAAFCALVNTAIIAQGNENLTPLQRQIEQQRQRLSSSEIEERRDALMKLGALKRPEASRAAVSALNDAEPIVRVTAAHAIASLPSAESAALLIPLLKDKLEFVRREAARALGETRSRSAVSALTESLSSDKEAGVRAAVATALGQIGDEAAVPALSQILSGAPTKKKSKARANEFVLRAAAQALGEIRSPAAVDVLIASLANEANPGDVRRAAATALGLIGDSAALPALQAALQSDDPYLSEAARQAMRQLRSSKN